MPATTRLILPLVLIILAVNFPGAAAAESVRTREINQCLKGEIVTWGDGTDRPAISPQMKFAYNHAGAPAWFSEELVSGMVSKAAAEWANCGLHPSMVAWSVFNVLKPDVIRVQWSEEGSRGNFGLANVGMRTISLGPRIFGVLKTRRPTYDGHDTLQLVISHEMGHFFGLMAHSRRCIDVVSYYDNGKGEKCYSRDPAQMRGYREYRYEFPTACDIERCRKLNGMPQLPDGRLPERSAHHD